MVRATAYSYFSQMKKGISKEFELLYRQHYQKVLRLCLGYVSGDKDLAQDLLQESFIKVWEHWDSFRGTSSRSTWLYRITVNTCLQELRMHKKYKKAPEDVLNNKAVSNDNSMQKEQQFLQLYACMSKLNKENQTILLLELEQIPQEEIAQIIGIKHNALRTRLNRIKSTLTKCVKNENI